MPPRRSSFARWTRFRSPPERLATFFSWSGPLKLNDATYARAGTLLSFEPEERRAVSSAGGARLLLLLAPWPGEGHYRGG